MQGKIGIEARFPPTSNLTKVFLGGYFFFMFVGLVAEQFNALWFVGGLLLGGLPWIGGVIGYFRTEGCREGYNAAIDDALRVIAPICADIYANRLTAADLDLKIGRAFIELRPNRPTDERAILGGWVG